MVAGMAWRCRIAANSAHKRRANRARFDRAAKSVRRVSVGRPVTTTLRSWRWPRTRTFFVPVIALMSLPMVNPCALARLERTETLPSPQRPSFRRKLIPKNWTLAEAPTSATLNSDRTLRLSQACTSNRVPSNRTAGLSVAQYDT